MTNHSIIEVQQKNWNAVAREWSDHFAWYANAFQPFVEWCGEAIAITPGMRILDIASGTGLPALQLAQRLQKSGAVVATDLSPEMLRVVAARAEAMHLRNFTVQQMDAQALEFPDASFDAVTCAFGLMFCPEPARVLAEMRRVLKSGGRFAIATWAPPAENSFIAIYGRAIAQVLSLPPYDRLAPGPFRFTQCDELQTLLRDAGFVDVTVAKRMQTVTYASVDEYQATSQALTPGLTDRIKSMSSADATRLRELIQAGVQPFLEGQAAHLIATPICATGSTE